MSSSNTAAQIPLDAAPTSLDLAGLNQASPVAVSDNAQTGNANISASADVISPAISAGNTVSAISVMSNAAITGPKDNIEDARLYDEPYVLVAATMSLVSLQYAFLPRKDMGQIDTTVKNVMQIKTDSPPAIIMRYPELVKALNLLLKQPTYQDLWAPHIVKICKSMKDHKCPSVRYSFFVAGSILIKSQFWLGMMDCALEQQEAYGDTLVTYAILTKNFPPKSKNGYISKEQLERWPCNDPAVQAAALRVVSSFFERSYLCPTVDPVGFNVKLPEVCVSLLSL